MASISGARVRGITLHQCVYRSAVMLGWQEAEIPSAGVECEFNCNPRRGQAAKVGGTLYPHSPWWRNLCIRLNINLLNQRSMCLPRVCPLLVTAPFLWLQHVCGTVCRPLSHRRNRCCKLNISAALTLGANRQYYPTSRYQMWCWNINLLLGPILRYAPLLRPNVN